jgi:hypothetical protein
MSIEDINYLKKNSIRQYYTFLVDSKDRNRRVYPEPAEYSIEFTTPFKNIIGLEVLDVSVPKTMYNIDVNNNKLYFYLAIDGNNNVNITYDEEGNEIYDKSIFTYIELEPGDYKTTTFIDALRILIKQVTGEKLDILSVSTPSDLTNSIYFVSQYPFILDMHRSTMAEVLGFDLYTSEKENLKEPTKKKYTFNEYNRKVGFEKLYHSIINNVGLHIIKAPGMMYLIGYKYLLLRCPEIEEHLYRSLSYTKYNLGLAKIRINSYGYNDEKTSFLKVPLREFHPIGKLSRITLRFETESGELYDFKGVNHNIVFAIYYYEPKQEIMVSKSILNPEYNPNFINYLYKQEEQEGESDDDQEDLSRDNIDIYKKHELEYNRASIDNRNTMIAYNKRLKDESLKNQKLYLESKANKILSSSSEYETTSDEESE